MPGPSFRIAGRQVGGGARAFLIAEVAQAHDGSLGLAHAFIEAAAEAGADAIKFQTHIASAESTVDEPWRVKFSYQDDTRYAYWQRVAFTEAQWTGLAEHAHARDLVFLSSAFSSTAIDLLARLDMPAWKIASGEIASRGHLEQMAATGKPFLVSTGMSPWTEITATVELLRRWEAAFAVMQCSSRYPTPLEQVGLNVLEAFRSRFACPVGLSDHSGTPFPALAAIGRGADVVELHVTFDRRMFGPDTPASVTFAEFASIRAFREAVATMDANPVDKDANAEDLAGMRGLFMRSVALTQALPAGTELTAELVTSKKPGTGIPAERLVEVIGRRLARPVAGDRLLTWEDLA